jgi:Tol biopolymer transport system component
MFGSADGERFVFQADASGAFSDGQTGTKNQYVATRQAAGWASVPVSPRTKTYVASWVDGFIDFACESCASVVGTTFQPVAEGDADRPVFGDPRVDVYLGGAPDTLQWLSGGPVGGTASADPASQAVYAGRSADGSHVAFDVADALLPEVAAAGLPANARVAYERTGPSLTELQVVGKDDSGAVMAGGSFIGGGGGHLMQHAVSEDGRKIFFQSPADGSPAHLYVRIDGARTVEVSAPQCGGTAATCDGTGLVYSSGDSFLGASPDGDTVYFMSEQRLVDTDTNSDLDIYRYDLTDGRLTQVSRGPAGSGIIAANSIRRVSDDGTAIFFTSSGILTDTPNGDGEHAVDGAANLYMYRGSVSDPQGEVRFIGNYAGDADSDTTDGGRAVAMTPDGRTVVFVAFPEGPPRPLQVYRYLWESGRTECLSCGGTEGSTLFSQRASDQSAGGYIQGKMPFRPSRNLTDDGHTVFFETASPLSPRDVNGKVDVYEWHDGTVHLLSSGTDRDDSYFMDASADGRDVFIATRAQLAPTDTDQAIDIYDVRSGGGWLAATPAECSSEGCQGTPGAVPGTASVGSASLLAPRQSQGSSRAPGRLRVSPPRTVVGASTKLRVTVPAAGRVRVSGPGLKSTETMARRAGAASVTASLSKQAQRRLRHKGNLTVQTTVRFSPAQGRAQRSTVSLTFKSKHQRSSQKQRRANVPSSDSRKGR